MINRGTIFALPIHLDIWIRSINILDQMFPYSYLLIGRCDEWLLYEQLDKQYTYINAKRGIAVLNVVQSWYEMDSLAHNVCQWKVTWIISIMVWRRST